MARAEHSALRLIRGVTRSSQGRLAVTLLVLALAGLLLGSIGARSVGGLLLFPSLVLLAQSVRDARVREDIPDELTTSALPSWWKTRSPDRGMRKLTLREYRELLVEVEPPSRKQIEAFARFVATAHSWYKHLSLLPPGQPMTFFLDPDAGAEILVDRRGSIHRLGRPGHGFHYSSLPTADYRACFGRAAFARGAGSGTIVLLDLADGARLLPSDYLPAVFDSSRGELVALPDEVIAAGTALISAAVHPRASHAALWQSVRDSDATDWPAESGGASVLSQIRERARALIHDQQLIEPPPDPAPSPYLNGCDFVLYRLLAPERERQQRGVVSSLERVVELVR